MKKYGVAFGLLGILLCGPAVQGFILIEHYEFPMNRCNALLPEFARAQSFTNTHPGNGVFVVAISLYGYHDMSEDGYVECKLATTNQYGLPTEEVLSTGRILISQLPEEQAEWFTIPMSPAVLSPQVKYVMEFRVTNPDALVHLYWRVNEQGYGMYYYGDFLYYMGGCWTNDPTIDYRFRVWGYDSHLQVINR